MNKIKSRVGDVMRNLDNQGQSQGPLTPRKVPLPPFDTVRYCTLTVLRIV